jgi:hypothetical protein
MYASIIPRLEAVEGIKARNIFVIHCRKYILSGSVRHPSRDAISSYMRVLFSKGLSRAENSQIESDNSALSQHNRDEVDQVGCHQEPSHSPRDLPVPDQG